MIKQILKKNNIYLLKDAAKLLDIRQDTLKHQCQRGERNAVCLAGLLWLVVLTEEDVFVEKMKHWVPDYHEAD